jgi:hypothetical protein
MITSGTWSARKDVPGQIQQFRLPLRRRGRGLASQVHLGQRDPLLTGLNPGDVRLGDAEALGDLAAGET